MVTFTEDIQAHQSHHFCRSIDVFLVTGFVVIAFAQIKFHAAEERFDQGMIDVVLIDGELKTVENGIQAESALDRGIGLGLEIGQQRGFIEVMKGIHDLIGQANEPIDVVDGLAQVIVQQPDRRGKRGTVPLGELAAAGLAGCMK